MFMLIIYFDQIKPLASLGCIIYVVRNVKAIVYQWQVVLWLKCVYFKQQKSLLF